MKRFVIALLACVALLPACARGAGPKVEPPKPQVYMFLLVQCEQPLAFLFLASDGTSRYVGMDDREALNQIAAQVPKENRYWVLLPDPDNGCPEEPIST